MRRHTVIVGSALALLLVAIGTADFLLKERPAMLALRTLRDRAEEEEPSEEPNGAPIAHEQEEGEETQEPGVARGVSRRDGPNVREVLVEQEYTWTEAGGSEPRLLQTVVPGDALQVLALLRDNDRAAFLAWTEHPDARALLQDLKRNLQEVFSPDLSDLLDESQFPEAGAPRDILSFRDPAILPERIVFVRVRTRLYEFHIREGNEREIMDLIDALAR